MLWAQQPTGTKKSFVKGQLWALGLVPIVCVWAWRYTWFALKKPSPLVETNSNSDFVNPDSLVIGSGIITLGRIWLSQTLLTHMEQNFNVRRVSSL